MTPRDRSPNLLRRDRNPQIVSVLVHERVPSHALLVRIHKLELVRQRGRKSLLALRLGLGLLALRRERRLGKVGDPAENANVDVFQLDKGVPDEGEECLVVVLAGGEGNAGSRGRERWVEVVVDEGVEAEDVGS